MSDASWASSPRILKVMRGNRSRDTKPELAVRRILHADGLRYRVNARPLPQFPRTADVLFTRRQIAVFIDGCYWHGCPEHYTAPKTNPDYRRTKVERNAERDIETSTTLMNAGWTVLRFWSHSRPEDIAAAIEAQVLAPSAQATGQPT